MAVSEESRHHLYNKLEDVLGSEDAAVLMEYLPPVGWADVATKRDLDALENRMFARFAAVDARFDSVDARFGGRFEIVNARFDSVDARFDSVDARFDSVDARFDIVEARLRSYFEHEMRLLTWRLLVIIVATMSLLVAVTRAFS